MTTSAIYFVFFIISISFTMPSVAQNIFKLKTSEGTAKLRIESNMTQIEAKQKVVELAKIKAIENEFGSFIEQESRLTVESGKSDFYIVGNTRVKGIWVNEINRDIEQYINDKGENWITCTIKGKVKAAKARPAIEYKVQNCMLPQCETYTFTSNDQLYLWFRSPVDGYLSVFFEDANENVYRILPYSYEPTQSHYTIEADRNYMFFSPDQEIEKPGGNRVDELILETNRKREMNNLIIVFSTHEFFKPSLEKSADPYMPPSISQKKFEKWMSDYRATDDGFIDVTLHLEIKSGS